MITKNYNRSNESIILRDFIQEDSDKINEIAYAAWSQYEGVFSEWKSFVDFIRNVSKLADYLQFIVAVRNNELIGFVAYIGPHVKREKIFPDDWAVLRLLSVLPSMRGCGVGLSLTNECIKRAKKDGAKILGLHSSPVLQSALNLYLRIGFVFAKSIPKRRSVSYSVYVLHL